jgi:hypothetical protein
MSKTKRLGHTARIKALEDEVRHLTANLPKEIHHAVRTELRVAVSEVAASAVHEIRRVKLPPSLTANPCQIFPTGFDSYNELKG